MRKVNCTKIPGSLDILDIYATSKPKMQETVSLFDSSDRFLGYATVTAVRTDPKWPDAYRYDVRVIDE